MTRLHPYVGANPPEVVFDLSPDRWPWRPLDGLVRYFPSTLLRGKGPWYCPKPSVPDLAPAVFVPSRLRLSPVRIAPFHLTHHAQIVACPTRATGGDGSLVLALLLRADVTAGGGGAVGGAPVIGVGGELAVERATEPSAAGL